MSGCRDTAACGVLLFPDTGRPSSAVFISWARRPCCAVPSAGIRTGIDCRCPQLQAAKVAVGDGGIFSVEDCLSTPNLFLSHGDAVAKGKPLGTRFSCGHSNGSGSTGV